MRGLTITAPRQKWAALLMAAMLVDGHAYAADTVVTVKCGLRKFRLDPISAGVELWNAEHAIWRDICTRADCSYRDGVWRMVNVDGTYREVITISRNTGNFERNVYSRGNITSGTSETCESVADPALNRTQQF